MAVDAPEREMVSKKRADDGKRDDMAVKVDRTLADKAALVARRRGISMAEYLSALISGRRKGFREGSQGDG